MLLTTPSRKDATALVEKIDKNTPKGLGLCDGTDSLKTIHLSARLVKDITVEEERKRKCRLIIRNLSFQAIEENIISKFQKFGPIVEVTIPKVPITIKQSLDKNNPSKSHAKNESNQQQKLKPSGFGFITLLCANDAEKAVNGGCEGMKICNREFAVDFCLNRHAHEWELKRDEDGIHSDPPELSTQNKDEKNNNINITIGEKNESINQIEEVENDEIQESDCDDEDEGDEEEIEIDKENEDDNENNNQKTVDDNVEEDDKEEEDKPKSMEDVSEGRTIFVRFVIC